MEHNTSSLVSQQWCCFSQKTFHSFHLCYILLYQASLAPRAVLLFWLALPCCNLCFLFCLSSHPISSGYSLACHTFCPTCHLQVDMWKIQRRDGNLVVLLFLQTDFFLLLTINTSIYRRYSQSSRLVDFTVKQFEILANVDSQMFVATVYYEKLIYA